MSVNAEQASRIVEEAARQVNQIATLPEITMKIIELVEDPSSTAQDLLNLIQNDPALCSRILKVVNSSFYGLPGQIASMNRAIVLLGLNAVKNIAISASVSKLFRGGELAANFSGKALWTHSVITAAVARQIGVTLKLGMADEIFLSGLMHDIGVMVEVQFDRNKFIEVLEKVKPDKEGVPANDFMTAEQDVFGADHQAFGAAIAKKWKFPKALCDVTGHHHNPMALPAGERKLAAIVYIADRLAAEVDPDTYRMDLNTLDIDPSIMDEIGLTEETLAKMRAGLAEQIEDALAVMF